MYKEHIKEIEGIITNYFQGLFDGDINKLETCFHQTATVSGDIKGVEYFKTIDDFLEGVKQRQSPRDLNESFKMEIIGIEIIGQIAMAKLHVPMFNYNYYDYLSFSKIDDDWKIVNKIFTHIE